MPNRYLCDVLEEMRVANKTRNYSYLKGLIEEVQHAGNRMEAGLYDKKTYFGLLEEIKELKTNVSKLKNDRNSLKQQVEALSVKKKTLEKQISKATHNVKSSNTPKQN